MATATVAFYYSYVASAPRMSCRVHRVVGRLEKTDQTDATQPKQRNRAMEGDHRENLSTVGASTCCIYVAQHIFIKFFFVYWPVNRAFNATHCNKQHWAVSPTKIRSVFNVLISISIQLICHTGILYA